MKVCVVGAGAIGSFIGSQLARSGCAVSALARGATAAALRTHGFRFQRDGAVDTVPVRVAEESAALGPQDLVVVAVKGPSLEGVAGKVGPLLAPETMVLTAMNGVPWWFFHGIGGTHEGVAVRAVDPAGRIATAIPARHVIGCVVHATCSVLEPGLVHHGFGRELIIGEPDGGATTRLRGLAERLTAAGFEVTVSKRIQADIWYKLWGNMTMNPMSALTGATCDRLLDDPLLERFTLAIMAEATTIGEKIGCPIRQSGEERNAGDAQAGRVQDLHAPGRGGGQTARDRRAPHRGARDRRARRGAHPQHRRAAGPGPGVRGRARSPLRERTPP